jgi:hypothetical protein
MPEGFCSSKCHNKSMIIWNQINSIKSIKDKMEARTIEPWLMGKELEAMMPIADKPKRKYVLVDIAVSLWVYLLMSSLF